MHDGYVNYSIWSLLLTLLLQFCLLIALRFSYLYQVRSMMYREVGYWGRERVAKVDRQVEVATQNNGHFQK